MDEVQEAAIVEAALDDLGVDATAEQILQATRGYSEAAINIALRRLGGGGGGGPQTLQLLGPYTVDFDDPGVNDSKIDLADLTAGTVVIRAFGFVTEAWDSPVNDGFQFSLEIGNSGDTESVVVTDYPTSPGTLASWIEGSVTTPTGLTTLVGRTTGTGWKLRAVAYANGSGDPTVGSIDWYALAYVPA